MARFAPLAQRLEAERARLQEEIAILAARLPATDASPNDSAYGNHSADEATEIFEDEQTLALQTHLQGVLTEVEAALARLAAGTYGNCERCGTTIPAERLEALPWARYCVPCKAALERRR